MAPACWDDTSKAMYNVSIRHKLSHRNSAIVTLLLLAYSILDQSAALPSLRRGASYSISWRLCVTL